MAKHTFRRGQERRVKLALHFFLSLIFCLLFTSCDNVFGNGLSEVSLLSQYEKQYVDFTGHYSISGAYPQKVIEILNQVQNEDSVPVPETRTAMPSMPTGVTVKAKATATGYSDIEITVPSGSNTFTISGLETNASNPVTWTITVTMYDGTSPILSDYCQKELTLAAPVFTNDFLLKPDSSSGTGIVGLSMTVPTTIDEISLSCPDDSWTVTSAPISSGTATISASSIPSGSYLVQIDFKQNGFIVYSDVQAINVFKNMTTGTWLYGQGSDAITSSGYVLTQTLIESFSKTRIYVGTTTLGSESDTTGNGSPFAPFETIGRAIDYILEMNSSLTNYTILITGEITGAQLFNSNINLKAGAITLEGARGLDDSGNPQDSLNGGFDSGHNGTTLTVKTNVPMTIKNLLITGGYNNNDNNGGGITIANSAVKLTLDSGTHIKGNYTKYCGAGVFNLSGTLKIKSGVEISGNHEVSDNSGNGGGGVFIYDGKLIMSGGIIKGNSALHDGGGLYVERRNVESSAIYIW